MPADFTSGVFVEKAAWHQQGTVIPEAPDWDQVPALAGWPVKLDRRQVFVETSSDGLDEFLPWDEHYAQVGTYTDGTERVLGVAGPDYEVVSPPQMIELVRALAGEGAVPETAGSLHHGQWLWVMARGAEPFTVPGDDSLTVPYLSVINSFDRQLAYSAQTHIVRIQCANTVNAAIAQASRGQGAMYRFRHMGDVQAKVEAAREVLFNLGTQAQEFLEMATELTSIKVRPKGVTLFLERFVPTPPNATDRVLANIDEQRAAVRSILNGDTGTVAAAHSRTAYGLFLAGTEFFEHGRKAQADDTPIRRALFEPPEAAKRIVKLAREVAKVR